MTAATVSCTAGAPAQKGLIIDDRSGKNGVVIDRSKIRPIDSNLQQINKGLGQIALTGYRDAETKRNESLVQAASAEKDVQAQRVVVAASDVKLANEKQVLAQNNELLANQSKRVHEAKDKAAASQTKANSSQAQATASQENAVAKQAELSKSKAQLDAIRAQKAELLARIAAQKQQQTPQAAGTPVTATV